MSAGTLERTIEDVVEMAKVDPLVKEAGGFAVIKGGDGEPYHVAVKPKTKLSDTMENMVVGRYEKTDDGKWSEILRARAVGDST